MLISFVGLALLGLLLGIKKDKRFTDFFFLIYLVAVGVSFALNMSAGDNLIWALLAIVSANFLLSRFTFAKSMYVGLAIAPISALVILLIHSGLNISHLDQSYNVVNKFSVLGIMLAAFIPVITKLKMAALAKVFGLELKEMSNAVGVFIIGIAIYLSVFGAGFVGLYTVSAIISISALYQNEWLRISVSAIILAMMGNLALYVGIAEVDLMGGDVLFGAFIGAFGVFLLSSLFDDNDKNVVVSFAIVLIALGASFALGYAGFSHANMCGEDALIAVLF